MTGRKLPLDKARGKKVDFEKILLLCSNNLRERRTGACNFSCSFVGLWDVRPVFLYFSSPGRLCPQSKPLAQAEPAYPGGWVTAGVGLIFWCCLYPDKHDQRLKLAGFLGTVYAEGWPDRVDRLKDPPVKSPNQGASEQPAYALLHPETPASQVEPEKKLPKPRPSRIAPKGPPAAPQDKAGKNAKVTKAPAPPSKKDKIGRQEPRQEKEPGFRPGRQAGRCRLEPRGPRPGPRVTHIRCDPPPTKTPESYCLQGLEAAPPVAAALPPLGVTVAPGLSQPNGNHRPGRRDGQPGGPRQPDSGAGAGTGLCRILWGGLCL